VKAAILFRFHTHFDSCRERLKLIRSLNTDVPIYGLYGGPRVGLSDAQRQLNGLLDHIALIPTDDFRWKWMHSDLTIRHWFRTYGHRLEFAVLYDHEYDLLLLRPFALLCPQISGRAVALSGVMGLKSVQASWFWTSVSPHKEHFKRYLRFMRDRYGLDDQAYISQGPFPVLTREFLAAISSLTYPRDIFDPVMSEISLPGIAEALGYHINDTGWHPPWAAHVPGVPASPLFHCEREPQVTEGQVLAELRRPGGRRAFHPVKVAIRYQRIHRLLEEDTDGCRRGRR